MEKKLPFKSHRRDDALTRWRQIPRRGGVPVFAISLALAIWLAALSGLSRAIAADASQPCQCVVLLHGLGRTADSMETMGRALESTGYITANVDYPSREQPIEELAVDVIPQGLKRCRENKAHRIHFVTHSMGGILVRYYLSRHNIPELGRVVMLSPPNQGSEVTDALQDKALYQWFNGPAGQQLGTHSESFVRQLGPVKFSLGVITGTEHALFDIWLADLIPGPDDGKVSVERAKVEGMADFLALPYAHPFIMAEDEVIAQTIHFLSHGRFKR